VKRWLLTLLCLPLLAQAELSVVDSSGRNVTLQQPAQRIVSLAPHVTELLFAAGAGERVVGVVSYSDWPPAAREIEQVGSYSALDMERILALRPDLVVAWESGNNPAQLERLERLGLTVLRHAPRLPEDIARVLEQLGLLAGTDAVAQPAAQDFRARLQGLRERNAQAAPLTVFYQVWHQPLMTVNGAHLISAAIELCGGRNVFAALPALAPQISIEAVLAADPQVIVASGMAEQRPDWLDDWKRWPQLTAVQHDNLYFVPPDLLQRAGPRFIDGAERLCAALEQARRR
jgi:iron complex transport system substrate-binding protein